MLKQAEKLLVFLAEGKEVEGGWSDCDALAELAGLKLIEAADPTLTVPHWIVTPTGYARAAEIQGRAATPNVVWVTLEVMVPEAHELAVQVPDDFDSWKTPLRCRMLDALFEAEYPHNDPGEHGIEGTIVDSAPTYAVKMTPNRKLRVKKVK